jgi:hypothetical protein
VTPLGCTCFGFNLAREQPGERSGFGSKVAGSEPESAINSCVILARESNLTHNHLDSGGDVIYII